MNAAIKHYTMTGRTNTRPGVVTYRNLVYASLRVIPWLSERIDRPGSGLVSTHSRLRLVQILSVSTLSGLRLSQIQSTDFPIDIPMKADKAC